VDDIPAGAAQAIRTDPGDARADDPVPAATAARRWIRRPPRLYLTGLALVAAALAAATGFLAVTLSGSVSAARQRSAVLAAARQEAVNLTTLGQGSGSRDFAAVLAGAAGSLRQQLAQGRADFLRTLGSAGVSSAGSVLDAGIVTMSSGRATVLLNVKATVRNKQTFAPETRLYHWQAGLVDSGGRWLVTSLEFV
jgi:Mce-associated membrane protein